MIIVSTDGSCLRNPGGAIGWAWVDHTGPSMSGGEASGTNQIAELRALLEAVLAHPGDEPLLIESDSQYAIKCASEWLPGWKRKGWKTAGGSPVSNLELVQAIDRAITDRTGPVRFRWVRGHVGNHFNEMADVLAGEAARAVASGALAPGAVISSGSAFDSDAIAGSPSAGSPSAAASKAVPPKAVPPKAVPPKAAPKAMASSSVSSGAAAGYLDEVPTLF